MTASDSFNEIASLRIELEDSTPPIWRAVEVPTSLTLKTLHDVIQAAMGWFDCHLWAFDLDGQSYGPHDPEDWRDPPQRDAGKTRLRDLLRGKTGIELIYEYDFGDGWRHRLVVSDVRQGNVAESYPRYIAGENAGPPEDCGGIPGFYHMLDAWNDPRHPEHAEASEYLEDWDPQDVDELPLRIALSRIANRRNAVRKRLSNATQDKI